MRRIAIAAIMVGALGGCIGSMGSKPTLVTTDVVAMLRDAQDAARGTASVEAGGGSTRITIDGIGLPPGAHGLHIHEIGRCDAPDFMTAGAHWNPGTRQHGRDNPMGAHRGDLPNLLIGTDGRGSLSFDMAQGPGALLDADGAAIIVHAVADDLRSDPSGNSGARIACGVFESR